MVRKVVKSKVRDLEEEVREYFLRGMSEKLTGVVQGVSGKKRFLVRFQDGCENDMTSNQLTILIVENSPVEKELEVPTITEIPDDTFTSEKVYYHGVYVMLHFNKEDGVDRKYEQVEVEVEVDLDPDEEDMGDVKLYNERERHWRIFFEDNDIGVYDKKLILHAKRWDV